MPLANRITAGRPQLLDLPTFTGLAEEWPMFFIEFRQSTATYGYGQIENTYRLRKCLQGDAKKLVEGLLMYPQNVEQVLYTLQLSYGRPESLIRSQLEKIRGLRPIEEHELAKIIPFAATIQSVVSFLNNEIMQSHLSNPVLLEEIVGKLPPTQRLAWAKESAPLTQPNVQHLSTWLTGLAYYAGVASTSTSGTNTTRKDTRGPKSNFVGSLAEAHEDGARQHSKAPNNNCSICDTGSHQLADCTAFCNMSVNKRWEIVKAEKRCSTCLHTKHRRSDCRSSITCGVGRCNARHHKLLHNQRSTAVEEPEPSGEPAPATTDQAMVGLSRRVRTSTPSVLYRTLPVVLWGPNGQIPTYAVFDEGSFTTLLDDELASQLGLVGQNNPLKLQWYKDRTNTVEPSRSVSLQISGPAKFAKKYELEGVRTIDGIVLPSSVMGSEQLREEYAHLKNVPIPDLHNAKPRMLIGLNYSTLGLHDEEIRGRDDEPIAAKTKLGWLVYGPCSKADDRENALLYTRAEEQTLEELHQCVKDYYTTENFGVSVLNNLPKSADEKRALEILETTTVRVGPRFQTGLLWRNDDTQLPDSRSMAMRRLRNVEDKMARDSTYAAMYKENIENYVKKGYARKLTATEAAKTSRRTWYLPHFGVSNPNKPGRLRLVFDAAAAVEGVSLNSMLLTGPDQIQSLSTILHRFRLGAVGICGDIREMFHQILIQPEDRDSQRFLWRGGNPSIPPDTYVMDAMTFGASCSPCSAQHVKNANADDYKEQYPDAVKAIHESHYVDDYVISFATPEDAIRVTTEVVQIHARGGFELRNFVTNCPEVMSAIGGRPESTTSNLPDEGALHTDKILGMLWDTKHDCFTFRFKCHRIDADVRSGARAPTKREILSVAMSTFDPFGLLANFTIHAKLLVQELWRAGLGWDEQVEGDTLERWRTWLDELRRISECLVPRCYSGVIRTTKELQLHLFADASEAAFSCVAYWRIQVSEDEYDVSFIAGKTKCAPPKMLSVPRLELQAAVLATRLSASIKEIHNELLPKKIVYWTDSTTVVSWVRSDHRRYKSFVAHRIAEILEGSDERDWRWIPTKENVADDATRARLPLSFDAKSRWLNGPDFLRQPESHWPLEPESRRSAETNEEIRHCLLQIVEPADCGLLDLGPILQLTSALRVMAYCFRFAHNARNPDNKTRGEFTVDEMEAAERDLVRRTQCEHFADERAALMIGQPVARSSSLRLLSPYLDGEGIIRLNGRINAAVAVDEDTRRPIIMPKTNKLTTLIVAHYHRLLKHQNQESIVCAVRQRYWIPHLRTLVRKAQLECIFCRVRSAKPAAQIMGQLPEDRVTPNVRPFTFTGLDYFGPVNVTIGRRREKRWVALFTCLTVRAVHLELARDLSTDACILCLRNFINTRGAPRRIRSDNGTNFVGAAKELNNAVGDLDQNAIKRELTGRGIEWLFNSPANPEAGGCWERMVRSVKRVLSVTLHEAAPQVETLRSLLIEAANVINSRPLTHVPVSSVEEEPLTPNHFLLGTNNATQTTPDPDVPDHCLRKQWRIARLLANRFWRRWILEYLPELTRRTRWHDEVPALKIGDLVLIVDEAARGQWKRGIVAETFAGPDGRVRSAMVRTSSTMLRRPVTKLALLDIRTGDGEPASVAVHGGENVADGPATGAGGERDVDEQEDAV